MSRTSMDKSRHHSIIKLRMKHEIEGSQYKDIQEMLQYDEVQLYHIVFVGTTRFTTRYFAKTKRNDDSCILYRFNTLIYVGFIQYILLVNEKTFFKIKKVAFKEDLHCTHGNRKFQCRNISIGSINNDESGVFLKAEDAIEKLVHYQETPNFIYFFRFPTLLESS
ncbi:unnamed protein product [Rotaria magnacalcarata]|uniref:Uncharacterized protein n=1 Tax=Rotaria magnacalcarata TaxID=392030 RepID=A0A820KB18_9BILA|nr:unnamed protein product [Rotaria magnacalcarata]CAF4338948.1 unnamed protein product [Rotaria magnacalcarata]CAF4448602.1 unnamed protein product [Rotaria magnacalcarata]